MMNEKKGKRLKICTFDLLFFIHINYGQKKVTYIEVYIKIFLVISSHFIKSQYERKTIRRRNYLWPSTSWEP